MGVKRRLGRIWFSDFAGSSSSLLWSCQEAQVRPAITITMILQIKR